MNRERHTWVEFADPERGRENSTGSRNGNQIAKKAVESCLRRELSVMELATEGYWRCYSPCGHIQAKEEGAQCGKCGGVMEWNGPVI